MGGTGEATDAGEGVLQESGNVTNRSSLLGSLRKDVA